MTEEKNCENCANVHCYRFTPKYELCKNGSLWQPYRDTRTKIKNFKKMIKSLFSSQPK